MIGLALGLSACGRRETPVMEGVRTGTLLVGLGAECGSLDPHQMTAVYESQVGLALFEGLTAIDEKTLAAVPAAAERWEVSADGLEYTFFALPRAAGARAHPGHLGLGGGLCGCLLVSGNFPDWQWQQLDGLGQS